MAQKYQASTRMLGESHVFINDSNAERELSSLYVQIFAIANSTSKYPSYHLWKRKPSCLQNVFGLRVYNLAWGHMLSWPGRVKLYDLSKYDDEIMTLCHGNTFRITSPLCWASTGDHKRSVMRSFKLFFLLLLLVLTSSWTNRRVVGDGIIENIGDLLSNL